jgi:hypothetical protein
MTGSACSLSRLSATDQRALLRILKMLVDE